MAMTADSEELTFQEANAVNKSKQICMDAVVAISKVRVSGEGAKNNNDPGLPTDFSCIPFLAEARGGYKYHSRGVCRHEGSKRQW